MKLLEETRNPNYDPMENPFSPFSSLKDFVEYKLMEMNTIDGGWLEYSNQSKPNALDWAILYECLVRIIDSDNTKDIRSDVMEMINEAEKEVKG